MSEIEKKLWRRVNVYLKILRMVPFLRMVGVCNNLAFSRVGEKSDIDLFIIAKSGRLFFVRTFVTFLLHVFGVRRHGDKVAGRFCLSFFVDDSALDLSEIAIKNDIYLAFWIRSMMPIIDDGVYTDFLKANSWSDLFFESDEVFDDRLAMEIEKRSLTTFFRSMLSFAFTGKIGDLIEGRLKKWQLNRARKKADNVDANSGILVGEHILKFHNIDRRVEYRGLWESRFGTQKLTNERFCSLLPYS